MNVFWFSEFIQKRKYVVFKSISFKVFWQSLIVSSISWQVELRRNRREKDYKMLVMSLKNSPTNIPFRVIMGACKETPQGERLILELEDNTIFLPPKANILQDSDIVELCNGDCIILKKKILWEEIMNFVFNLFIILYKKKTSVITAFFLYME